MVSQRKVSTFAPSSSRSQQGAALTGTNSDRPTTGRECLGAYYDPNLTITLNGSQVSPKRYNRRRSTKTSLGSPERDTNRYGELLEALSLSVNSSPDRRLRASDKPEPSSSVLSPTSDPRRTKSNLAAVMKATSKPRVVDLSGIESSVLRESTSNWLLASSLPILPTPQLFDVNEDLLRFKSHQNTSDSTKGVPPSGRVSQEFSATGHSTLPSIDDTSTPAPSFTRTQLKLQQEQALAYLEAASTSVGRARMQAEKRRQDRLEALEGSEITKSRIADRSRAAIESLAYHHVVHQRPHGSLNIDSSIDTSRNDATLLMCLEQLRLHVVQRNTGDLEAIIRQLRTFERQDTNLESITNGLDVEMMTVPQSLGFADSITETLRNDLYSDSSLVTGNSNSIIQLQDSTIVGLDLTNQGLTRERGVALSRALEFAPHLRVLRLGGNWLPAVPMTYILATAFHKMQLQTLDLSSNDLGQEGVALLERYLGSDSGKFLEELNLTACHLGDEYAAAIAVASTNLPKLRILRMANNEVGSSGSRYSYAWVDLLARSHYLTTLDLSENRIRGALSTAIFTACSASLSLITLSLASNQITDADASQAALCLTQNNTLVRLFLAHNLFGDRGTISLCFAATTVQSALLFLDLSGHQISPIVQRYAASVSWRVVRDSVAASGCLERFLNVAVDITDSLIDLPPPWSNNHIQSNMDASGLLVNPFDVSGTYEFDLSNPYERLMANLVLDTAAEYPGAALRDVRILHNTGVTGSRSVDNTEYTQLTCMEGAGPAGSAAQMAQSVGFTFDGGATVAEANEMYNQVKSVLMAKCIPSRTDALSKLVSAVGLTGLCGSHVDKIASSWEPFPADLIHDVENGFVACMHRLLLPVFGGKEAISAADIIRSVGIFSWFTERSFPSTPRISPVLESLCSTVTNNTTSSLLTIPSSVTLTPAERVFSHLFECTPCPPSDPLSLEWTITVIIQALLHRFFAPSVPSVTAGAIVQIGTNAPLELPLTGKLCVTVSSRRLTHWRGSRHGTTAALSSLIAALRFPCASMTTSCTTSEASGRFPSGIDVLSRILAGRDCILRLGVTEAELLLRWLSAAKCGTVVVLAEKLAWQIDHPADVSRFFTRTLSTPEILLLRRRLGPLFGTLTNNPSGHFHLDLSRPLHRFLLSRVRIYCATDATVAMETARTISYSQTASGTPLRNASYNGAWLDASLDWLENAPAVGRLRFDFVAGAQPIARLLPASTVAFAISTTACLPVVGHCKTASSNKTLSLESSGPAQIRYDGFADKIIDLLFGSRAASQLRRHFRGVHVQRSIACQKALQKLATNSIVSIDSEGESCTDDETPTEESVKIPANNKPSKTKTNAIGKATFFQLQDTSEDIDSGARKAFHRSPGVIRPTTKAELPVDDKPLQETAQVPVFSATVETLFGPGASTEQDEWRDLHETSSTQYRHAAEEATRKKLRVVYTDHAADMGWTPAHLRNWERDGWPPELFELSAAHAVCATPLLTHLNLSSGSRKLLMQESVACVDTTVEATSERQTPMSLSWEPVLQLFEVILLHGIWLSSRQLAGILDAFVTHHADSMVLVRLIMTAWTRLVDPLALSVAVSSIISKSAWREVWHRIGGLRLLNPCQPWGSFRFDLAQWDLRRCVYLLIDFLAVDAAAKSSLAMSETPCQHALTNTIEGENAANVCGKDIISTGSNLSLISQFRLCAQEPWKSFDLLSLIPIDSSRGPAVEPFVGHADTQYDSQLPKYGQLRLQISAEFCKERQRISSDLQRYLEGLLRH